MSSEMIQLYRCAGYMGLLCAVPGSVFCFHLPPAEQKNIPEGKIESPGDSPTSD
jgi:hypothetical protein